jgi:spore coat protein U-like protein
MICRTLFAAAFVAWLLPSPARGEAVSCTATITSIVYGTADVLLNQAVDTTGTLQISCTGPHNQTARVCANLGRMTPTPGTSGRRMAEGASNYLNHELYSDPARTQVWGSRAGAGYALAGCRSMFRSVRLEPGQRPELFTVGCWPASKQPRPAPTPRRFKVPSTASAPAHLTGGSTGNCPVGSYTQYASTSATATVPANCYVTAATLNFGSVGLIGTNVDAPSTIGLQCSNALPYTVALDGGQSGTTDPTQRKMSKGSEQITYGLYRDAARSLPWGSTGGTNTVPGVGNAAVQNLAVYGRMPAQTTPSPGVYADTVVVTVTY